MKFIRQFCIILLISFTGEVLKWILPLPVPASIYGMALMLLCLQTGIISIDAVREAGMFLIDIMPVMFIPAAVGLLNAWGALKPILIPGMVITLTTTIAVMAASGRATQFVIRRQGGPGRSEDPRQRKDKVRSKHPDTTNRKKEATQSYE